LTPPLDKMVKSQRNKVTSLISFATVSLIFEIRIVREGTSRRDQKTENAFPELDLDRSHQAGGEKADVGEVH